MKRLILTACLLLSAPAMAQQQPPPDPQTKALAVTNQDLLAGMIAARTQMYTEQARANALADRVRELEAKVPPASDASAK